jgi:hypothetical protein
MRIILSSSPRRGRAPAGTPPNAIITGGSQNFFLVRVYVYFNGDRPSWATILPVPFATTTTMLEAFVQEGVSLTLDRSASRLTMVAGPEVHIPSTKLILGGSDCKMPLRRFRETSVSCFPTLQVRGMWRRIRRGLWILWLSPRGTNPNPYDGRCVWSGGVRCPPGYNALGGRCVPN